MFRAMIVAPLDDPEVATTTLEAVQVLVDSVQRCTDEAARADGRSSRYRLGDRPVRSG